MSTSPRANELTVIKKLKKNFFIFSGSASAPASMVGRDFLTLKHYNHNEIVTLLWTALDLKKRIKHDQEVKSC